MARARAKVLISFFLFLRIFLHHVEAEQAGYRAVESTTEQQATRVAVTGLTEVIHEIEMLMDADYEAKDTAVEKKTKEEPSEERKRARVCMCSLVNCLTAPTKVKQTNPRLLSGPLCPPGLPSETTDDDLATRLFKEIL